jgi:D-galactose 1-dehydrogenase
VSIIKVGIVGVGKIARDQHIPAIAADPGLELVAVASRSKPDVGVPAFETAQSWMRSLCAPRPRRAGRRP